MSYATVTVTSDGSLAFRSSYDPLLVGELKRLIPYSDRRWDADNKQWLIAAKHLPTLEQITSSCLGIMLAQQGAIYAAKPQVETRVIRIDYIGAPKERDDGSFSAFGYSDGDWSVVFPQDVLKSWFEIGGTPEEKPVNTSTLYGAIGVRRTANEAEIKKAFRQMAKRWHPDINSDSDAPEMMKRINDAYEVLSNPMMRKKYDAGLALEASLNQRGSRPNSYANNWRPPIRCGYLMVEGYSQLGRFHVERILKWEDIIDGQGRVCVTSWAMGANHFTVSWI